MPCALVLALARVGNSNPARTAMMAMTTSNSMRVKPGVEELFVLNRILVKPPARPEDSPSLTIPGMTRHAGW